MFQAQASRGGTARTTWRKKSFAHSPGTGASRFTTRCTSCRAGMAGWAPGLGAVADGGIASLNTCCASRTAVDCVSDRGEGDAP